MSEQETAKCAYCGAVRPLSEMEKRKLYISAYKQPEYWYCKDKHCFNAAQSARDS